MSELGPLDTKWKIRDPVKGFITNEDGTISAVVHQWDRWASEMGRWLDSAFVRDNSWASGNYSIGLRPLSSMIRRHAGTPWKSAHRSSCAGFAGAPRPGVVAAGSGRRRARCKFGGGIKTGRGGLRSRRWRGVLAKNS